MFEDTKPWCLMITTDREATDFHFVHIVDGTEQEVASKVPPDQVLVCVVPAERSGWKNDTLQQLRWILSLGEEDCGPENIGGLITMLFARACDQLAEKYRTS